ncbi:unnamed protein product [Eruca vesicaria subsp. sativa]|uniref:Calcium-transporting ATPase n=1 Tax=Eruca vesicaria subsp. sativa TaxID=29727 RepID=A0ABC8LTF9_ERUVS|nr:unnamed protein product [Eruca vesicaria subsp. sativa]
MGKGGEDLVNKQTNGSESVKSDTFHAWAKDDRECEEKFGVSCEKGLTTEEVLKRHQIYGLNELEKPEGKSIFKLILEQFNDTLVCILLAAAVISFVLAFVDGEEGGEMGITAFVEPLVNFLILIVNAIVGIWQETNAEKALEALKEIKSQKATVMRDGNKISSLPAKELVPGDIVELRVGDKVPADMRVVALISSTLRIEQGSLTGESEAVSKTTKPVEENADIQGKKCMVFAGTTVVNGNCICLVTDTGMSTEIGRVHSQIQEAAQHEEDTPLKKKLNEFGEALTMIIGLICALVWLINVKYFLSWEYVDGWPKNFKFSFEKCTYYFEITVALAVAAIPEGLPAVITTCLALGTRKMAQKNALVRKLPSVETLGCTTFICSDKTGTLTTNQMAVSKLVAMGSRIGTLRSFSVEGTSFDPRDGKIEDWPAGRMDANLQMIAKIAAICNDANVEKSDNQFVTRGMPTEAALKVLGEKMGFPEGSTKASTLADGDVLRCCRLWSELEQRLATLEFDRDRKSMGVMVDFSSGRKLLLVKVCAVENVLERSTHIQLLDDSTPELDQYLRDLILQSLHDLSMGALRCLGFAYADVPSDFATYDGSEHHPAHQELLNPSNYSSIESNLTFVRQAIADCRTAVIRVMVITGDNKSTAEAICREIGVFEADEDISTRSLTGKEFMDVQDQKNHLRQIGGLLFSRAEPKHKQEIVRLLKEDGKVVAMTGDGVNDAHALKLVDIGVAMGISGTEVAKEASDMVLADDNFSTIVAAVGEGRSIYNNMKAFIRYMISSNIGEVASIFLTAALGIPEGMIPVQLLWVNLVTDGPPATALGFNPPDKDIMKKPPRRSDDSLITPWILFRYMVIGMYVGVATVGVFIIWYTHSSFMGIDLSQDGHSLMSYSQLANWGQCSSWEGFKVSPFTAGSQTFSFDSNPCEYFHQGKIKASTLSLSVLVAIEMFNSLNALSEDGSLVTMPPWVNPWLLLAMAVSFGLHFVIFYVPFMAQVFGIVPLNLNEWLLVLAVSLPVILIDEVLKFVGRLTSGYRYSTRAPSAKQKTE